MRKKAIPGLLTAVMMLALSSQALSQAGGAGGAGGTAAKQHGTMRKTKHRGIASVAADFMLNLIAYNLIRIPKLLAA